MEVMRCSYRPTDSVLRNDRAVNRRSTAGHYRGSAGVACRKRLGYTYGPNAIFQMWNGYKLSASIISVAQLLAVWAGIIRLFRVIQKVLIIDFILLYALIIWIFQMSMHVSATYKTNRYMKGKVLQRMRTFTNVLNELK